MLRHIDTGHVMPCTSFIKLEIVEVGITYLKRLI